MTTYETEGGGTTSLQGGGHKTAEIGVISPVYNPTDWLVSAQRTLKAYVEHFFDPRIWDVRFGFPSDAELQGLMPMDRTIIHFEIDDINNQILGIGKSIVQDDYDQFTHLVKEIEGGMHNISWDIGIWASAKSGGTTSRLLAYQILNDLFYGPSAKDSFRAVTKGLEIREFTGGQFIKEEINDLDVYRVVGISLMTRAMSLRIPQSIPTIEIINIVSELIIRGEIVITE